MPPFSDSNILVLSGKARCSRLSISQVLSSRLINLILALVLVAETSNPSGELETALFISSV